MSRIAILDDDPVTLSLAKHHLSSSGNACYVFFRAGAFLRCLETDSFDLVMLDWDVADVPCPEVIRYLRLGMRPYTPALVTVSEQRDLNLAQIRRCGADDCLTKPVIAFELIARIRDLMQQASDPIRSAQIIEVKPCRLDVAQQMVFRNGQTVRLSSVDFQLAVVMFRNLGRPLSREFLSTQSGIEQCYGARANIDSHVRRIRARLGLHSGSELELVNIRGYGYRLQRNSAWNDLGEAHA